MLNDLTYSNRVGYIQFPATETIVIDLTPGNDNSTVVRSFQVPLASLNNTAVSVLASGFLTTDDENVANLQPFGLFAVLPNGGAFVPLANVTSIEEDNYPIQATLYPNPANKFIYLNIQTLSNTTVSLRIIDLQGRVMLAKQDVNLVSGQNTITLNVSDLSNGIYHIEIFNQEMRQIHKFIK